LHRKGLAVAVILLFFSVSVIPSTGTTDVEKSTTSTFYEGNTLYVGGSGANNYTTIQDAVDAAVYGNTVFVYNGTYYENLNIHTSILLKGQDQNTTIIDGNHTNTTITITSDHTIITGFTITHAGPTEYAAGILIHANHTYIHHNLIINNTPTGIRIPHQTNDGITHITITHNSISDSHVGIYLRLVAHTLISNNYLEDNYCAISTNIGFLVNGCENTTIHHNSLKNNQYGIDLNGGWKTTIHHNNFKNNTRHAKFFLENDAIWDNNYWDRPRIFPKILLGRSLAFIIITYPVINIDWNPASEPYDIGV